LSWTRSGWIQFCRSPEEFGREIAELVESISELVAEKYADESVQASRASKQINADYYEEQIFALIFNEHAQYEAHSSLCV